MPASSEASGARAERGRHAGGAQPQPASLAAIVAVVAVVHFNIVVAAAAAAADGVNLALGVAALMFDVVRLSRILQ